MGTFKPHQPTLKSASSLKRKSLFPREFFRRKKVAGLGFEPTGKSLSLQEVAKLDSQIDSQSTRDSELKQIIVAWDGLPRALRQAILAIVAL